MLREKIVRAQSGSQDDMNDLVTKFTPLLKRYSHKLFLEDALSELTLSFIEAIYLIPLDKLKNQSDGALVNYIVMCVKNAYVDLVRKSIKAPQSSVSIEDMTESQLFDISIPSIDTEAGTFEDLLAACPRLTKKESDVLRYIYLYGYSSTDIARLLSSSKQNINQTKLRAIRKMRQSIQL